MTSTLPADSLANDTSPYVPPCGWGPLGFPTLAQINEKLAAKPIDEQAKNLASIRFGMMPVQAIVMQIQKDSEKQAKWTAALTDIDCSTGSDVKLLRENHSVWASVLQSVPLLKAKLEVLVDQPHLLLRKNDDDDTASKSPRKDLDIKFLTKRGTLLVVHSAPEGVSSLFHQAGVSSVDGGGEINWELTIGATRVLFSMEPSSRNFQLVVSPAIIFDPTNPPPVAIASGVLNDKESTPSLEEEENSSITSVEGKDILLSRLESLAFAEALAGFHDMVPSFPQEGRFQEVVAMVFSHLIK